jgi:dUTPase
MIKYCKIRDVKDPLRSTLKSGGIDFYVPAFDNAFIRTFNARNTNARSMAYYDESKNNIYVHPHGEVMIPLGIKLELPKGFVLIAMNKSGASFEFRISKLSELIDEDYMDEVFTCLYNFSEYATIIRSGMKIIQYALLPVAYDELSLVKEEELHIIPTDRKGGMGSTGLD